MSRTALSLVVVAMLSPLATPAAGHHNFLQASYPAANKRVAPPSEVTLQFEGKADAIFSSMTLRRLGGSLVAEMTQAKASRNMVLETPKLEPGEYMVEYRVLAMDGQIVKGGFFFTVDDRDI